MSMFVYVYVCVCVNEFEWVVKKEHLMIRKIMLCIKNDKLITFESRFIMEHI